MSDLNEYANDRLLDFLDAFHIELRTVLEVLHGNDWFEKGVQRHIGKTYLDRTRQMLNSPMRVVDMGKNDEEIYGSNIYPTSLTETGMALRIVLLTGTEQRSSSVRSPKFVTTSHTDGKVTIYDEKIWLGSYKTAAHY